MQHPIEAAEETYARALAELEAEMRAEDGMSAEEREFFDRADRHVRATIGISVLVVVLLVIAEAFGYA